MRRYVLTGGPCVGKTTLIELLHKKGFHTVPESALQIIGEENLELVGTDGWEGLADFQEKVAQRQLVLEKDLPGDEATFLDRGIIDGAAYCELGNVAIPQTIIENAEGRYTTIFILDFLEEYKAGQGRPESREDAEKIHSKIHEMYLRYGYTVIAVPRGDNESRCKFILEHL